MITITSPKSSSKEGRNVASFDSLMPRFSTWNCLRLIRESSWRPSEKGFVSYTLSQKPKSSSPHQPLLSINFILDFTHPKDICRTFIHKAVLSSTPFSSNPANDHLCVVMAIYGEKSGLALARPGDNTWVEVETPIKLFVDIVYYKDQFYAVNDCGLVVVCDISGNPSAPDYLPRATMTRVFFDRCYLVESSGNLLLILRQIIRKEWSRGISNIPLCRTHRFQIFQMDISSSPKCWVEISNLGDHAYFQVRILLYFYS
ncbi:hypothetical protein GIB67_008253 [Kingdonia uniflora]|uniref:KIB1-4 beta-propeller domain-containing protein n=1 Tax=Kingdonia uniflora TaxID=39325 RepID=A0A7J7N4X4_9MAGN|nr:hypothetical protein GIB67_008253 [Kingdonia uniflora]